MPHLTHTVPVESGPWHYDVVTDSIFVSLVVKFLISLKQGFSAVARLTFGLDNS